MNPARPTVFCLNLRFGLAEDGINGWSHRKDIVFQLTRAYSADFYAFQEVNNFQAKDLQTALPHYGIIGERRCAPDRWQNNLIFYHPNWHCDRSRHFYLSDTPEIPSQFEKSIWPRQCTVGLFSSLKKQLVLVNTHFDFDTEVQVKSARLILDQLQSFTRSAPILLTGDFNATPAAPWYNTFTGDNQQNHFAGDRVGQSFINAFNQPYPPTFHGFTGQAEGGMIDWILYRGDLRTVKAKVITDSVKNRYPSDHFPLLAQFDWLA